MADADSWFQRFIGRRRVWIRDARARRVPLVDVEGLLASAAGGPDRTDRERDAAVRRAVVRGIGKSQWFHIGLNLVLWLVVLGCLVVSVYFGVRSATPRSGWVLTGVIGLNSVLSFFFVLHSVRVTRAAHLASSLVGVGCCASCGYDVRQLAAGGDGARVCPECGAAWRVPAEGAIVTDDDAAAAYRDVGVRSEWFGRAMRGLGRWIGSWRR